MSIYDDPVRGDLYHEVEIDAYDDDYEGNA
jgi:hypothetical protein